MAITAEQRTELMELVVLMFNAAPGATYLNDLVNLYEFLGGDLRAVAQVLGDLPGFRGDENFPGVHPDAQTDEEFLEAFLSPLGLQDDAYVLETIQGLLDAGWSKADIIYESYVALNSVTDDMPAQYVAARDILANKVAVATYYSAPPPTGVGIAQTDFAILQSVLDGVTDNDNTVTTALGEINAGTRGVPGQEFTLTTVQNTVDGGNAADLINGLFGDATATYTAGDDIDGGAGNDTLNLVATGTTASPAIKVVEVETIAIQDTVGATFNATLVTNSTTAGTTISFNNTVAGNTSTVTGGSKAFTYGLDGKGHLTVNMTALTGTADEAKLMLNSVGTSATVRSTVNVANANAIEKVSIAATGTNFVALNAGTGAATVTVTGSGTNNFDLSAAGAVAAVVTIDASTTTGANTFALGTTLNTADNIKGGTAADTVSATFSTASLVKPTMTGVETFATTFTDNAVVDLGGSTGLTGVTVSNTAAAMETVTFQNAASTVANVTVSNVAATAANSAFLFGYAAADKGNLALKIGSTSATATAVDLGDVTLTNTSSVAISTLGALDHDLDVVKIAGTQTALGITTAADSSLTAASITVAGAAGDLSINLGADSFYSGGIYASKGISSVTANIGAGAELDGWVETTGAGANIGDVTVNVTADDALAALYVYADEGSIGDVTANITGDDNSGFIAGTASGDGSFGSMTLNITGDDNEFGFYFSGGANYGSEEAPEASDLTVTVVGDGNVVDMYHDTSGGDIGAITVTVTGDDNSGYQNFHPGIVYYEDDDGHYQYVGGGNVGDIAITVDGDSSWTVSGAISGGSVGNITLDVDNGGYIDFNLTANTVNWMSGASETAGNFGNITLNIGEDSSISGGVSGQGDAGDFTVNAIGDNASGLFSLTMTETSGAYGSDLDSNDYARGGSVGHVSITVDGDNASFGSRIEASGGSIDGAEFSLNGDDASGRLEMSAQRTASGSEGGDIGDVNITIGDGAGRFQLGVNLDGSVALNVVGGDDVASGNFYFSGGWNYDNTNDASIDSVTMTWGENANTWLEVGQFSGSVGDVSATYGDGSSAGFKFSGITGDVGNLTATFGDDGEFFMGVVDVDGDVGATSVTFGTGANFYIGISGAMPSVGSITIAGGDAGSSGGVYLSDATTPINAFGGVDASAWLGAIGIDLEGVTLGTIARVGAGGSWVRGTEGADNIFLGAGVDEVEFDTSITAVDTIFTFTNGAAGDKLDIANTANFTAYSVNTTDTVANGDLTKLTDIAGNQDITTSAGLLAALNTGGEYAGIDAPATFTEHYTFVTAASATATTFYIFDVTNTDADAEFEAATLIGVVNTTNAFSNLVAANLI